MIYNPTLQRWEGNEEALVSFSHPNTSTTTLALTTASTPTFAPPGNQMSRGHDRSQSISHIALSSIHANQTHHQAHRSFSSRAAKLAQPPAPAPVPSPPRPALISQISVPRNVQYEGRMVFDPVKMTWLKAPRPANEIGSPSEVDEEEDPFAGLDDLKDNESVAGGNGMGGAGTPNPDDPTFVGEEFDVGPGFIRRQRDEEAIWRRWHPTRRLEMGDSRLRRCQCSRWTPGILTTTTLVLLCALTQTHDLMIACIADQIWSLGATLLLDYVPHTQKLMMTLPWNVFFLRYPPYPRVLRWA
jgi:hypothetical protein